METLAVLSLILFEVLTENEFHNLLQHNPKTGKLEPTGKLREIMEEINND